MKKYINCHSLCLVALLGGLGCTAPLTETDLRLATQRLNQDFGSATGTLPSIACSAQLDPCAFFPVGTSGVRVTCDLPNKECAGSYSTLYYYEIDLSKDTAFKTGIGQMTADSIRQITLSYGLTNKLTFALPVTEIFVGPGGVTSTSAPGVTRVGSIGPFPAGEDVPDDAQQLVIAEGTPAFDLLVDRIAHPEQPFRFLLPITLAFRAGNAFPAGTMELRLTPILKLLKR